MFRPSPPGRVPAKPIRSDLSATGVLVLGPSGIRTWTDRTVQTARRWTEPAAPKPKLEKRVAGLNAARRTSPNRQAVAALALALDMKNDVTA
jgi:hypothetical protein